MSVPEEEISDDKIVETVKNTMEERARAQSTLKETQELLQRANTEHTHLLDSVQNWAAAVRRSTDSLGASGRLLTHIKQQIHVLEVSTFPISLRSIYFSSLFSI